MISVIIPTYKEPEYLDLCLRSAFEGQVNKNEIIVVVDGFYELNKSVLDKYPEVVILNLETNQGLSVATNWGVYNSTYDYVLIKPSMFRQFHIHDLGKNTEEFDLYKFWEYEKNLFQDSDQTGCTLPFAMYKYDYLAVGGWDIMYPSPHVVDWDFFLKCEYFGMEMLRLYKHFYHFASVSTRKTPEQSAESTRKEMLAHDFFGLKWNTRAEHNPLDNSKLLRKFKQK